MEFDFFDSSSSFDINGVKYLKKSKLNPKRLSILMFSDFSLSGKKSPISFDKAFLPPFFDIYNIYIVNNEGFGQFNVINEMIKLENLLSVGYVDYTEDYLSGYNFYIQTTNKLLITSFQLASNVIKWVEGLKLLLSYAPTIATKHAKHAFIDPPRIIKSLEQFDSRSFLDSNMNMFRIKQYKLNEKFDKTAFELSIKQLKNMLKVLKFNEGLANHVQSFLVEFHTQLCKSVSNSSFEFNIADMSFIYKTIRRYCYLLEKYNVVDICLAKFLIRLNNSLFEQLRNEVLITLRVDILKYVDESNQLHSKLNFYNVVFEAIGNYIKADTKLKISHDLCSSIVSRVIGVLKWQIIMNKDFGIASTINVFNSCLEFNDIYFTFIEQNHSKTLDDKFIEQMTDDRLVTENNSLIEVALNQIENNFEYQIQIYFNDNYEFSKIELGKLFNYEFMNDMKIINLKLAKTYAEPMFNRILNFSLMFYFSKSFI